MRKDIILILFLILLAGCISPECRQVQKTDACGGFSGWTLYEITGHPPDCLDEKSCEEFKKICPNFNEKGRWLMK